MKLTRVPRLFSILAFGIMLAGPLSVFRPGDATGQVSRTSREEALADRQYRLDEAMNQFREKEKKLAEREDALRQREARLEQQRADLLAGPQEEVAVLRHAQEKLKRDIRSHEKEINALMVTREALEREIEETQRDPGLIEENRGLLAVSGG